MNELQQKLARRRNLNGEKLDGGSKEGEVSTVTSSVNPPSAVCVPTQNVKPIPAKEQIPVNASTSAVDELQSKLFRRRSLNGEMNAKVPDSTVHQSVNNTSESSAPSAEKLDPHESNKLEIIPSVSTLSNSSIPTDATNESHQDCAVDMTANDPPTAAQTNQFPTTNGTSEELLAVVPCEVENAEQVPAINNLPPEEFKQEVVIQVASEALLNEAKIPPSLEVAETTSKVEIVPNGKGSARTNALLDTLTKDSEIDDFVESMLVRSNSITKTGAKVEAGGNKVKPFDSKAGGKKGKPVGGLFDDDDDGELMFTSSPAIVIEPAISFPTETKEKLSPKVSTTKSVTVTATVSPSSTTPVKDPSQSPIQTQNKMIEPPKPSEAVVIENITSRKSTSSRSSSQDNLNNTGSGHSEKNIPTIPSSNNSGSNSPRQPHTPRQSSSSSTDASTSTPSSSKWYPGKYLMERRTPWSSKNNKIAINAEQAQSMYNDFVATGRTMSVEVKDPSSLLTASLANEVEKYANTTGTTGIMTNHHETVPIQSSSSTVLSGRSSVPSVSFRRRSHVRKDYTIAELVEENERLQEEIERLRNELDTKQAIIDAYESTAGLSTTEGEEGDAGNGELSIESRSARDKRVSVVLTSILGPDPTLPLFENIEDIDLDAIASKTANIRKHHIRGHGGGVGGERLVSDYAQDTRQLLIAAIDAAAVHVPGGNNKKTLGMLPTMNGGDGEEDEEAGLTDATTAKFRRRVGGVGGGGGRLFDDDTAATTTSSSSSATDQTKTNTKTIVPGAATRKALAFQELLKDNPSPRVEGEEEESARTTSIITGGQELDLLLANAKVGYNPTQSATSEKDLIRSFVTSSSASSSTTRTGAYNQSLVDHGLVTATPAKSSLISDGGTEDANTDTSEGGSKKTGDLFESSASNNDKEAEEEEIVETMHYTEFLSKFTKCNSLVNITRLFIWSIAGPHGDGQPGPKKKKEEYIFYGTHKLEERCRQFFDEMQEAFIQFPSFQHENEDRLMSARDHLEIYVMQRIGSFAMDAILKVYDSEDQMLMKRMKLLSHFLSVESLEITEELFDETLLILAGEELRKINTFRTPGEKVECVEKSVTTIFKSLSLARTKHETDENQSENSSSSASKNDSSASFAGADDFLPLFIWVVLRSHIPRLLSNCVYIESYLSPARLMSKSGYCLINLRSAIEFVNSAEASSVSMTEEDFETKLNEAEDLYRQGKL